MANYEEVFKKVVAHAKEYGFIFQSSELYDGLGAVYDYGPNGVELKNNIRNYWWKSMVNMNDNVVGLDSAIFMHPTTWKASVIEPQIETSNHYLNGLLATLCVAILD